MAFVQEVPISLLTKDPRKVPPPQAYTGLEAGPSFYEADNHARELLTHMDLPPIPKNLKPLIHRWEDLEDQGKGLSKRIQLMPDRGLSLVQEASEISFGLEPAPSMEEIWSEVDQALMLNDGMGPLDVGGYDTRYLFTFTPKPRVNIFTAPCFDGCSKNMTVVKLSTPDNVLFNCQHKTCACSKNIIDELASKDAYTIWLLDSGASMHFTPNRFDFTSYEEIHNEFATTASGQEMNIKGKGSVFLKHNFRSQVLFEENDNTQTIRISPIYHVEGLHGCLLSLSTFLKKGFTCEGSAHEILLCDMQRKDFMTFTSIQRHETCYHLSSVITRRSIFMANYTMYVANYWTWHKHLGHMSEQAFRQLMDNTKDFPHVKIPSSTPVCPGCAQGKMASKPFPDSKSRATANFELIHSDLKELPTISYHKYKYFIVFVDD